MSCVKLKLSLVREKQIVGCIAPKEVVRLDPSRARGVGSMWQHLKPQISMLAQCTCDLSNGYNVLNTVHVELCLQKDSCNIESTDQDEREAYVPGGSQDLPNYPHCLTLSLSLWNLQKLVHRFTFSGTWLFLTMVWFPT